MWGEVLAIRYNFMLQQTINPAPFSRVLEWLTVSSMS